ncbi:GntR family phosphonate transport system transcriptional regulator [Dongia mobilis]|uniref:GntR family phosphonate transport system transcriptional regulator n=1 Tax=Dongia mobilis TaxID=578943 RepID=A0A4R6WRC0_9PROT|nr:phosphonate metabolism transcriptional regulator PhnF [Dongia mobilis]TDQ84135.1 GntR family phosphonate transport system transcriptional regulator [Dongia mobilis]
MEITREAGLTVWRQIQQIIESEIRGKLYQPGKRLPTEAEFARRFQVNRHTVRRALSRLEERGLLRTEQGRGTFVQEAVIDYKVARRTRFSENLAQQHRAPNRTLLAASDMPASTEVARALRLRRGAPVVYLLTTGEADGRRISVSAHYFPKPRFDGMAVLVAETRSISTALKKMGVEEFTRAQTRILARMPTAEDARQLEMPRNRPMLVTEGINVDAQGARIEFSISRFCSDWVQILVEP